MDPASRTRNVDVDCSVGNPPPRTRDLANNQTLDYMQTIDGKNGYTMN